MQNSRCHVMHRDPITFIFRYLPNSDLIESGNVDRLNEIVEFENGIFQEIRSDFVVLDNAANLQLLDPIRNWNQFSYKNKNKS